MHIGTVTKAHIQGSPAMLNSSTFAAPCKVCVQFLYLYLLVIAAYSYKIWSPNIILDYPLEIYTLKFFYAKQYLYISNIDKKYIVEVSIMCFIVI